MEPAEDASVEAEDPWIGTVVWSDIELLSVVGAGAMGRVYRAHQRGIDRDVAVKILHRELSGNAQLLQRFNREAKIASKLQHPHVVEVYLAGQLPDGSLATVMEFLDGKSLSTVIKEAGGALPVERALSIALQICDAVGEGHARGIVHRDLKPENVMIVRRAETDDWVKVLDFGIAKLSLGEQSIETAAGLIFGTARYISPEGAQGATVGPRGDVYSLATMIYQMLAGRTPFDAAQPVGMLVKHIHEVPPPLSVASVPASIAEIVMTNLAKDPEARAPNARVLANALAAAAREENLALSDVGVLARLSHVDATPSAAPRGSSQTPTAPTPTPVPAQATASAPTPAPAQKTPVLVLVLTFLLGVALTALATQYVTQHRNAERDAHVARARRALADNHFIAPPEENVRELVATGLARWPDEITFVQIRSDGSHELSTRAMAARSVGDVAQARDLAQAARALDPTDGTALLLFEQYDDELSAGEIDGGRLAAPKVIVDLPRDPIRKGKTVEFTARVFLGGVHAALSDARFVLSETNPPREILTVPASSPSPGSFRSEVVITRDGTFSIVFEARADGSPFRAEREFSVMR